MASALESYVNHNTGGARPFKILNVSSAIVLILLICCVGIFALISTVSIVTADGRIIVGTLKGFDQTINLILDESHERVYSATQGVEQVILGLYIIRGDNVALIGEIDDEADSRLDFTDIKAEPLNSVLH